MNTKVRSGWLRGFRWALAACVLLGIALAALAWEDDTGSLSIRLRAGLSAAEQAAVIARHGGTVESAVAPLRIQVVRVRAGDLPAALADYQADPQVESAEEVRSRRAEWLPNDPQIGSQWALERIGWPAVYSTQIPTGTATVALLDTGVDADHPDLAGRLIPGTSFINGTDGRTDPSGHGTRLAGLISAIADNGEGLAGVAYAGVKVMPVTVLDVGGGGADNAIVAGIVWAADHGADVILMGFSGPDPSRHLQDAIDYAWAKGVVLVAATGNGGLETPTYPAANRGVIGIAATDQDDGLADFSNRGPAVFLAAPGVDLATTEGPDGYAAVSGTSPAAALTAGAAALLKALDPTLTNGVLLGRLARGAAPAADPQDSDYAAKYGYGRLDLGGALADALTANAMEPVEPVGALIAVDGEGGPAAGASGGAPAGSAPASGDRTVTPYTINTAVLNGPTVSILGTRNLGANQVTLNLQSSATGTGWFTLLAGSGTACGTGDQVKAGQDRSGAAALRRGSLSLTADGAGSYTVRNLTQSTDYRLCFTADDGATLQSTPATADLATTAASALGADWDWGTVGSAGFSAGWAWRPSLAFAPKGTPYVAYRDGGNSDKATVMTLNGASWVTVGNAGFSAGETDYTSLAFAPDGTPYLAYMDLDNFGKVTVMKFTATLSPADATGTVTFMDGTATLGTAPVSVGTATYSTSAQSPGDHQLTAAYDGDANHGPSTSAPLTQTVLPAMTSVTVNTAPPGLTITVDGQSYSAPQTFQWAPGSGHSIGATQYQDVSAGRRYAFGAWSDGGARTHTITVPAAAATLTAGFDTQYQLSTALTPAGTGTVSPATGGWYAAGTLVTVKAFPGAGYGFTGWEGPVADPQASTTSLTLGAPAAIVVRVVGSPVLTATIAGKSGPAPARVWTLRLRNSGQSTAQAARIGALTLTQTFGPACTPVVASQFPVPVGDLPVGQAASGAVIIDFGACAAAARFTAGIGYGANGGAVSGTNSYGNQFR